MKPPIFIRSAAQISVVPQTVDPDTAPVLDFDVPYLRAADPDFGAWLKPMEARRMGRLLKRAVATSEQALHEAGIERPDAIITGTGLGCVESTERFLEALCRDGEQLLSPTHFMQSTHNTIGALIAIRARCHGYNATFSQRSISFDSALHNARLLMDCGRAETALVSGHDEVTPTYYGLLRRMQFVGRPGQCPCTEASAAFVLTHEVSGRNACRLAGTRLVHGYKDTDLSTILRDMLDTAGMEAEDISAIMTGHSGSEADTAHYAATDGLFAHDPLKLYYKYVFGENYSASALGFYAAVHVMQTGRIPMRMAMDHTGRPTHHPLRGMLLVTCSGESDLALTLLTTA